MGKKFVKWGLIALAVPVVVCGIGSIGFAVFSWVTFFGFSLMSLSS